MKVMVIVGARPNFMKAAPILKAFTQHNELTPSSGGSAAEKVRIECILVHTGQHYDAQMSDAFFTDLNLPQPDVFLGVGSESHAAQTAEIMKRFEPVLLQHSPHAVLVVGDVNSTVACALVAAKIDYGTGQRRPLIAHVEAGLRSFDRSMPEEINRILTDHLADLLFVTEESGLRNLQKEGVAGEKVFLVGNTMIDSLQAAQEKADASSVLHRLGLHHGASAPPQAYALLTLHRPANVDHAAAFGEILDGLRELAAQLPIVFPAHPRTRKRIQENGLQSYFAAAGTERPANDEKRGILMIDSLGYLDFLCLMKYARLVVTDSGGIQEETTGLGVPCVTVRENTERPITVETGTNLLAGVSREGIREAVERQLARTGKGKVPELWDGQAAQRIVEILLQQVPAQDFSKSSASC